MRPWRAAFRLPPTGLRSKVATVCAAAFLATGGAPAAAAVGAYSFRHVTLIDGVGGPAVPDCTIVVDGGKIAAISKTGPRDGARGRLIDARGKFLLPGLIDAHVHLSAPLRDRDAPLADRLERADEALAGYLYLGFTTIADLGNDPRLILEERRRERTGELLAPHIVAAGNLITSPGGKSADIGIEIAGMSEGQARLERQLKEQRPDFAKLVYDEQGWATQPLSSIWDPETLTAIIAFYHRRGLRTVVHIASELRAREAIEAGVDALAHPVTTGAESDAFIELMATRKIPFATTLAIRDNYARLVEHPEFLDRDDYRAVYTPAEREALRAAVRERYRASPMTGWSAAMLPIIMRNVKRIVDAGGVAALGSDMQSGAAAHREMYLLEQAGLSPLQVVSAATHNAAVLLGIEGHAGSVEVGKDADLLLVGRSPLESSGNLEAIVLVMKSGRIVDESRLQLPNGKARRRFH